MHGVDRVEVYASAEFSILGLAGAQVGFLRSALLRKPVCLGRKFDSPRGPAEMPNQLDFSQ